MTPQCHDTLLLALQLKKHDMLDFEVHVSAPVSGGGGFAGAAARGVGAAAVRGAGAAGARRRLAGLAAACRLGRARRRRRGIQRIQHTTNKQR